MIFSEGSKLDKTFVGEINKLEFKVIPVVEGEGISVNFFIERQPVKQALMFKVAVLFNPKLV